MTGKERIESIIYIHVKIVILRGVAMPNKTLQIRNSTAEFLIFTKQAGENGIEVRVQDGTIWLSQKLMATLFDCSP
jgi:hypothetical protein